MKDFLFRAIVVVGVALILASMTATGFVLYQGITGGRQFREDQARVWHDVLCAIESETQASPDITDEQREKALLFYDQLLIIANAKPCPKGVK